ncbi:MAG: flagellar hook-length control protein FliK [Spirochaetaceae bacterium]|jgi:hypothetical protein|nr:flagellar hook-length control protein FliK [Spirochaetaceae bacterium]
MQVSHLIQNTESPLSELSQKAGVEKSEKDDNPGVFARLLAGLLQNVHNPPKPGETEKFEPARVRGLSGKQERFPGAEVVPEEAAEEVSLGKKQGTQKIPGQNRIAGSEKVVRLLPERGKSGAGQDEVGEESPGVYEGAGVDSPAGAALPFRSLRDSDAPAPPEGAAGTAGLPEAGDAALGDGLPLAGAVPETLNYPGNASGPGDEPGKQPEPAAEKTETTGKTREGPLISGAAGTGDLSPAKAEEYRHGDDAGPEGERQDTAGQPRNRRKERFSPEIRDLRTTDQTNRAVSGAGDTLNAGTAEGGHENRSGPIPETELLVELRSAGAKTPAEISAEREARPAASFHEMLARELHQNLNGDIVRHASILLRDGGEGVIRLSLKPESLGNVKIRLELAENKIAGHIIVENDDVLRAFEREIRSLEQAFRDSGFEGANLEMSLARDGGQYGSRGREAANPFLEEPPAILRAAAYDTAGESLTKGIGVPGSLYGGADGRINMLV